MIEPLCYSVPETARLLGLGRNAAYEAIKRGEIPAIRIGGRVLVPRVQLEKMLAEDRFQRLAERTPPSEMGRDELGRWTRA